MNKRLDSFRFYAFLAVFLYHHKFLDGGYLGVQAFFVLSGFLLTPGLMSLKENNLKSYLKIFFGRRALRIFPVYYAYLFSIGFFAFLFIFVLRLKNGIVTNFYQLLPTAFTYSYNFFHAKIDFQFNPLINHFWSLAVEEQFYLFWPFVIWLTPNHKIIRVLVIFCVLGPIVRFATFLSVGSELLKNYLAWPELVIYLVPWSHLDAFAIGGLASLTCRQRVKGVSFIFFLTTCSIGFLLQYLNNGVIDWTTLGFPSIMHGNYRSIWGYSLLNLSFALILRDLDNKTLKVPTFDWPVIQYFGKISYGLYIFHFPLIYFFSRLFKANNSVPGAVLALISSIIIGALSFEFFEKRFLAQKDLWFSKDNQKPDPLVFQAAEMG